MLRPRDLTTAEYAMAVKPALGYEFQLWVSLEQSVEIGSVLVAAANSGVTTLSAPDLATLADTPQELLAVLDTDCNAGAADLVFTVTGTDQTDAALTGTATFATPAYATLSDRRWPTCWAVEVIPTVDGKKFKTVSDITTSCAATAVDAKVKFFGVPSLTTFKQIGCRTQADWSLKAPQVVAIQCGRDLSAFTKPGEIPEGTVNLTTKLTNFADSLARFNGMRVTGLLKEKKEDKLVTSHQFLLGLILNANPTAGESVDPATVSASGKYEDLGIVLPA